MKDVITLAREAGIYCWHKSWDSDDVARLERFAALVREDEREKQQSIEDSGSEVSLETDTQEPVVWTDNIGGFVEHESPDYPYPLYTTPPTAALAARQMRDAAVKVCREKAKDWKGVDWANAKHAAIALEKTIAALPVPDVQWRDLTDEEIDMLIDVEEYIRTVANQISVSNKLKAVIAKFKEKQL